MDQSSNAPMHLCHVNKLTIFINRTYTVIYSVALSFLLYYRASFFFHDTKTPILPSLIVFAAELVSSFEWLLTQAYRWRPVFRTVFPERLPEDDKLPAVDVFICTADPEKEPPVEVMNTVISAMALDYPPKKLHVYLSDDGGADVTLNGMREAWMFAKRWIPFCKRYKIKCRSPKAYFSAAEDENEDGDFGGTDFIQERQIVQEKYEVFKERVREYARHGDTLSSKRLDHSTVIEVETSQPLSPAHGFSAGANIIPEWFENQSSSSSVMMMLPTELDNESKPWIGYALYVCSEIHEDFDTSCAFKVMHKFDCYFDTNEGPLEKQTLSHELNVIVPPFTGPTGYWL